MKGDVLVLSFTEVKDICLSMQVKMIVQCLCCLCHPFFPVTFTLIRYLEVLGNVLARFPSAMSGIVLKFLEWRQLVNRSKRPIYFPLRFHLKTETRCGL